MMSVQQLTDLMATLIKEVRSKRGRAELGIYADGYVTTTSGTYNATKATNINLYEGKQCYVQITAEGQAIVIGG